MIELGLFAAAAVLALVSALVVVLQRNPIYSAFALIVTLCSLSVVYGLLGSPFIAVLQLVVYAGAIMVLFLFVIMLLNAGEEIPGHKNRYLMLLGAPLVVLLLGLISYFIIRYIPADEPVKLGSSATPFGNTASIGTTLFTQYLLPFEITSVLILIAIIGAIVLARKEID